MPEFRFYYPIEVRYGDLDPQGHVNNAKYLTYFEQARVHYLLRLGMFDEGQSFTNIGIILADAHVTFLASIRFGQPVRVGVRTSRLGNKSMTMEYCLEDAENGQELATGSTVLVGYDYRTNETIPIPEEWREKINRFEGLQVAG
ncbi:MAG: acyl-CoA thioesterase [Anaerolineales bacterium]|nr:acyl-CoA thioesterase [Anaerolineales bacterium]